MTSAYHCGNCPNLWKSTCPYYAWVETGQYGISSDSYIEFTGIVGCLSHPLAQAALREEGANQERERVLDEAIKQIKKLQYESARLQKESTTSIGDVAMNGRMNAYKISVGILSSPRQSQGTKTDIGKCTRKSDCNQYKHEGVTARCIGCGSLRQSQSAGGQ